MECDGYLYTLFIPQFVTGYGRKSKRVVMKLINRIQFKMYYRLYLDEWCEFLVTYISGVLRHCYRVPNYSNVIFILPLFYVITFTIPCVPASDDMSDTFMMHTHVFFIYNDKRMKLCASTRRTHGHYNDVIMSAMASKKTSLAIVCSTVCSGTDKKHQSSASLTIVRGVAGDRWKVGNADNVFIWWRYYALIRSC